MKFSERFTYLYLMMVRFGSNIFNITKRHNPFKFTVYNLSHLFVCLFIYLFIHLFIHLFVSLFIGSFIYHLFIQLFFAGYFDPATHFDQTVNEIPSRHFQKELEEQEEIKEQEQEQEQQEEQEEEEEEEDEEAAEELVELEGQDDATISSIGSPQYSSTVLEPTNEDATEPVSPEIRRVTDIRRPGKVLKLFI